jgi:hypothetical protein
MVNIVGITSFLWFNMNKGQWFSSARKISLTLLNILILCIGCVIVSDHISCLFNNYAAPLYHPTSHFSAIRGHPSSCRSHGWRKVLLCPIQHATSTQNSRFRATVGSPRLRDVTRRQGKLCGAILREKIAIHVVGEPRANGARVHDL